MRACVRARARTIEHASGGATSQLDDVKTARRKPGGTYLTSHLVIVRDGGGVWDFQEAETW